MRQVPYLIFVSCEYNFNKIMIENMIELIIAINYLEKLDERGLNPKWGRSSLCVHVCI